VGLSGPIASKAVVSLARVRTVPPPDRLPPTALETPGSLTPLTDSLEPLEQRVTIYSRGLVWDRVQVKQPGSASIEHLAPNTQMHFTLNSSHDGSA
jgi:hypothetical protein